MRAHPDSLIVHNLCVHTNTAPPRCGRRPRASRHQQFMPRTHVNTKSNLKTLPCRRMRFNMAISLGKNSTISEFERLACGSKMMCQFLRARVVWWWLVAAQSLVTAKKREGAGVDPIPSSESPEVRDNDLDIILGFCFTPENPPTAAAQRRLSTGHRRGVPSSIQLVILSMKPSESLKSEHRACHRARLQSSLCR